MQWWRRLSGGRSIVMIAVLLVLVAGLAFWATKKNPPDAPNPTATAAPEAMVPSATAPAGTPPAAAP